MSTTPQSITETREQSSASELSTYAYSYPHKSSYRPLVPPVSIAEAWRGEELRHLSLYVHVPFCEMRCGFCNLFTQSLPQGDIVDAYLRTLTRQMHVVRTAVPDANFRQVALGGGTPTFLSASQLNALLEQLEAVFAIRIGKIPASIEVSPATVTRDRLQILHDFGFERISIGVQSFLADETRQIGRPQRARQVHEALEHIRSVRFPVLNIDLIYGDPRQTCNSWLDSLQTALEYSPEELYLYPLYVRPQTGLGRAGSHPIEHRADLYRAARDLLLAAGYVQASLRCFRRPRVAAPSDYGCQRDGMIGLGCGARSYTRRLHYSTRFAVTQAGVRAILAAWIAQSNDDLALATHGIWLSDEEQQRRYLILSVLQAEGLAAAEFERRFPGSAITNFPEIADLIERAWLTEAGGHYTLTPAGLERSDLIGPLLYSQAVRDRLRTFIEMSPPPVGLPS